jgi:hypothetical protein
VTHPADQVIEEKRDGIYRARPEERPLLAYYANSIAHHF